MGERDCVDDTEHKQYEWTRKKATILSSNTIQPPTKERE